VPSVVILETQLEGLRLLAAEADGLGQQLGASDATAALILCTIINEAFAAFIREGIVDPDGAFARWHAAYRLRQREDPPPNLN
jgi:hypothetical protein